MLFYQTIRYLRCGQIVGQVRWRIRDRLCRPDFLPVRPIPTLPVCQWLAGRVYLPPVLGQNSAASLLAGRFCFLNDERDLGWPPDWDRIGFAKLWQYNLHYFDWLWALDYQDARGVTLDWIERHLLCRGAVGWDSYPTSLRLMNLMAYFWGCFREKTEQDPVFQQRLWQSVYRQTDWLSRRLEHHLAGNHLLENAAALAFTGSCFTGEVARTWRRLGLQLLQEQLLEQILHDGMHFERSPMYHARVLYVLELLAATGDEELCALVKPVLTRMRPALVKCTHPDGQIALLNDSAFGICHVPDALFSGNGHDACCAGAWALPEAGYYGWCDGDGNYLVCDAGAIGPDYIPGHAHADIFSFELSLRGHRVIVDAGVHDYQVSPERRYCRSTRAHNTVEIDGQDQCEMWAAFRVARRGYPRDIAWQPDESGFVLSGWHDGYQRLKGCPTHARRFEWRAGWGLLIQDRVTSGRPIQVISRLHLHPSCTVMDVDVERILVAYPAGEFSITYHNHGRMWCEESFYCPGFNQKLVNPVIALLSSGEKVETTIRIEPL